MPSQFDSYSDPATRATQPTEVNRVPILLELQVGLEALHQRQAESEKCCRAWSRTVDLRHSGRALYRLSHEGEMEAVGSGDAPFYAVAEGEKTSKC